jgi:hypothetical protein
MVAVARGECGGIAPGAAGVQVAQRWDATSTYRMRPTRMFFHRSILKKLV